MFKISSFRLLFWALLLVVVIAIPAEVEGETYVVFRYDDLSADQRGVRDINELRRQIWQAEQHLEEMFEKYGLCCVIGIIPRYDSFGEYGTGSVSFGEDDEKVKFIKRGVENGTIEVAQHGYTHTNRASVNHRIGEFRERDFKSQLLDIKSGKEILCEAIGIKDITTFIPPWNGWDNYTAKALLQSGFRVLSADRDYYAESDGELIIVPFTAQLWELESMLDKGALPDEAVIVVLFHPAQMIKFTGKEGRFLGFERFERLLQKLTAIPTIKVVTFEHLIQRDRSLTDARYRAANALWRQRSFWGGLLPASLWPGESGRCVYLATEVYTKEVRFWKAMAILLAVGLMFVGLTVRYAVRRLLSSEWYLWVDIAGSLLFCIGIASKIYLVWRGYSPTGIRMVPSFFATGFFVALFWHVISKMKPVGSKPS
ncbi:MAG: DUF2334 domain-containing protein [Sedimentisphaerales bacterium]